MVGTTKRMVHGALVRPNLSVWICCTVLAREGEERKKERIAGQGPMKSPLVALIENGAI